MIPRSALLLPLFVASCGSPPEMPGRAVDVTFTFGEAAPPVRNAEREFISERLGTSIGYPFPMNVSVVLPNRVTLSSYSCSSWGREVDGHSCSLVLHPLCGPQDFLVCIGKVEELARQIDISNRQDFQKKIAQWKALRPDSNDLTNLGFGWDFGGDQSLEDSMQFFAQIQGPANGIGFYLTIILSYTKPTLLERGGWSD